MIKRNHKMIKFNLLVMGIAFIALCGIALGQSFDYVIGTDFYSLPDISKPEKGVPYKDPTFHTTNLRITDKAEDGIDVDRNLMIPEYARSSPENADGSLLLLTFAEYSLYLYDAKTFELIKPLSEGRGGSIPLNLDGPNEARWDDEDPNVFYFVYAMTFNKYDVSTDTITLIHDFSAEFPDGWMIQNDVEGEPSKDRRYWAFSIRGNPPEYPNWSKFAIITYDMQEDLILGERTPVWPHNAVSISPYGDRILVEWYKSTDHYAYSYSLDFTDSMRLGQQGHSDMAIDADGNQVHVIKDDEYDWIAMIDLITGERTNIVKLPLTGSWSEEPALHISGNNYQRPGWVVISTYYGLPSAWDYFQVFMLELKENGRIWRIAHTHGKRSDPRDYWDETQATINEEGTRIYWASNWGENNGGDIDTYVSYLPDTWWEDLGGTPVEFNENINIPIRFKLHQNFPNPFNPITTINYQLPINCDVELNIYNALGQKVETLVSKRQRAGYHQIEWDASQFPSGVYYYRIDTGKFQDVKKMALIQ